MPTRSAPRKSPRCRTADRRRLGASRRHHPALGALVPKLCLGTRSAKLRFASTREAELPAPGTRAEPGHQRQHQAPRGVSAREAELPASGTRRSQGNSPGPGKRRRRAHKPRSICPAARCPTEIHAVCSLTGIALFLYFRLFSGMDGMSPASSWKGRGTGALSLQPDHRRHRSDARRASHGLRRAGGRRPPARPFLPNPTAASAIKSSAQPIPTEDPELGAQRCRDHGSGVDR